MDGIYPTGKIFAYIDAFSIKTTEKCNNAFTISLPLMK